MRKRHKYLFLGILLMIFAVIYLAMKNIPMLRGEEILPPSIVALLVVAPPQMPSLSCLHIGILAPRMDY